MLKGLKCCSRPVSDARNHGYYLALRHRPEPGLCRQRVFAGRGLLAFGRDVRWLQFLLVGVPILLFLI